MASPLLQLKQMEQRRNSELATARLHAHRRTQRRINEFVEDQQSKEEELRASAGIAPTSQVAPAQPNDESDFDEDDEDEEDNGQGA